MSSSNGSERPAEELVVVRVDDEINQALAGHGGRSAAVALARARRSRGRARARTAALHDRRMKRRDLERHLRAHGCRIIDEGSNHTRWGGPRRARSVMPRHREIDYGLARDGVGVNDPVVNEVLAFEDLPIDSTGSRRAIVRWSDGAEGTALRVVPDECSSVRAT